MKTEQLAEHREEVIDFIRSGMIEQRVSKEQAILETTCIFFWKLTDIENLYRCINSDFAPEVIKAIVAHDFNGLAREDVCFLPKSTQFGDDNAV